MPRFDLQDTHQQFQLRHEHLDQMLLEQRKQLYVQTHSETDRCYLLREMALFLLVVLKPYIVLIIMDKLFQISHAMLILMRLVLVQSIPTAEV